MNSNKNIPDQDTLEQLEFFKKVEVPFSKTKEDLWDKLSQKLDHKESNKPKGKLISMSWYKVTAAVIIILLGITSFTKLYTTTITTQKGEHLSHILPDQSVIELNAASAISYHPYWWSFNRTITLEGEAFFEVKKGSKFTVTSSNGSTEVLGTSFNIYARNTEYSVFCKTGKVKVCNNDSSIKLSLKPNEMAILDKVNSTGKIKLVSLDNITSWRSDEFRFEATPLKEVMEDIQIQYNVNIILDVDHPETLIYSGRFMKNKNVDVTLELICLSLNLNFTSQGKNNYKISTNN